MGHGPVSASGCSGIASLLPWVLVHASCHRTTSPVASEKQRPYHTQRLRWSRACALDARVRTIRVRL